MDMTDIASEMSWYAKALYSRMELCVHITKRYTVLSNILLHIEWYLLMNTLNITG
jgi:hypothetical protein